MKKKRAAVIAAVVIVLVAAVAAKVFLDHYIWAAGSFVSRSAPELDLTGKELSAEAYDRLHGEIPESRITWDVPFQGGKCISSARTIRVTSLTEEDVLTLDYFPDLTLLDAEECTDYPALMAFQARRPECEVTYWVTLGGRAYRNDTTALQLKDSSAEELEEMLPYLPAVTSVEMSGQLPEIAKLEALQKAFPEITFRWEVSLGDIMADNTTTRLDLAEKSLAGADMEQLLSWLPALETADMRGCGLSDAEMMALAQRYPRCFFLWDMTIGEVQVSTDAEEIDISGQTVESPEEIEALLPYFPNVKRVVMCKCGLDDETMDALNQKYEDIRFVWSGRIKDVYVRTDATYFYPFKFYRDMYVNTEDLYPLRYCTDMVCIDIGHMGDVENCEWAAFMPELKYLIIGETRISDLTPLSNCKKLAFLELFTIPATDYSPLVECTGLEDLNLGKTYGDPAPIAKMTWLKNLWWSGVDGTYGRPCSNAKAVLTEALPNTHLRFNLAHPTADGWRKLDNYFGMRDYMGMFYLS